MNPNNGNHSKESKRGKDIREILAEMNSCNLVIEKNTRRILKSVFEAKVETNKISFFLEELEKLLEKPERVKKGAKK